MVYIFYGDGYAAVDVVKTAVITGDGAAKVCEVVDRVTGCVPKSVDGGVGIHGLDD